MKESKTQIMAKAGNDIISSKIIANNTVEYFRENGDRVIRFHQTNIVTFKPDGDCILNSGGWLTVTTKERINRYLPGNWHLWQENRRWFLSVGNPYIGDCNQTYAYQDGVTITANGEIQNAGEFNPKDDRRLKRQIKTYINGFLTALSARKIKQPGPGDCWFCCLKTEQGQSLGQATKDASHILSHFKEKYYVPSLLMNAIEAIPVSQGAKHCIGYWLGYHDQRSEYWEDIAKTQISASMRRYLSEQLGMAR